MAKNKIYQAAKSGEAMKAEILNKLAAAFDTTKNKCIAITLNNYIHTAEGIAAEEFTENVYIWYLAALEGFGFKNQEAAAPESGEAEANQEAAADLVKMAAVCAFGFFGFYSVFAIFGV